MNTANTKILDARTRHTTELITGRAPNKSAKKPTPIAPKTKPKSNTALALRGFLSDKYQKGIQINTVIVQQ